MLSLVNVGLTEHLALRLAAALEVNTALRVVNVETNFISPSGVKALVQSLNTTKTVEELRASNQVDNPINQIFLGDHLLRPIQNT